MTTNESANDQTPDPVDELFRVLFKNLTSEEPKEETPIAYTLADFSKKIEELGADIPRHKTLIATYRDSREQAFIIHSWNVSERNGLLNLKVCNGGEGPMVYRLSIPMDNLRYFRIED